MENRSPEGHFFLESFVNSLFSFYSSSSFLHPLFPNLNPKAIEYIFILRAPPSPPPPLFFVKRQWHQNKTPVVAGSVYVHV